MYDEHPLMDYLRIWDSFLGKPKIQDNTIEVEIRNFHVLKEFPGFQYETIFKTGRLTLTGVQSSKRKIQEYIVSERKEFHLFNGTVHLERQFDKYKSSEPLEFKPSYSIDDGPFPETSGQKYLFDLSTYSFDPYAWVEWEVIAESIEVEGGEILKVFDE